MELSALVGNPRGWKPQTKTCVSGYARHAKTVSAAGAEEITD